MLTMKSVCTSLIVVLVMAQQACHTMEVQHHMRCRLLDVQQCLDPLKNFGDEMKGVFKPHDDDEIDKTCSAVEKVKECLAPIQPYCSGIVRRVFEGMVDGMDYLCQSESLKVYRQHEECLGHPDVQLASRNCSDIYSREITQISPIDKSTKDFYAAICKGVNDFLGCLQNDVSEHCGEEAGKWQYQMGLHFLRPVMEEVECSVVDPVTSVEICSTDRVNQCIVPLMEINQQMKDASLSMLPETSPRLNHSTVCGLLSNVTTCLEPIQPYCDLMLRRNFEGLTSGLEFFCNENSKKMFELHGHCLQSSTMIQRMAPCVSYMEDIQMARVNDLGDAKVMFDHMCRAMRRSMDCMYGAVSETCGERAAQWHEELSLSFLGPVLHSIGNCDLDSQESGKQGAQEGKGTRLGLAVGLCVLIVFVAGVILALLVFRRYRGGRLGRSSQPYSPNVFVADSSVSYKPLAEPSER